MSTFIKPGDVMTCVAPEGGVTIGIPVMIGGLLVVPKATAAVDVQFEAFISGAHYLPKTTSQEWTLFQKVYWKVATAKLTTTATDGALAGVAGEPAASDAEFCCVRLNGVSPATAEGPQATITDVTALTGAGGGTANGALEDELAFTPSVAWNGSSVYPSSADATAIAAVDTKLKNNVAELATAVASITTKFNTLLAELEAAGILASA